MSREESTPAPEAGTGTGTEPDGGLFARLSRYVDVLRGADLDVVAYRPGEHGPLVEFDGLGGYEEVERYWVDAPFAFVSVNYDDEAKEHRYQVVEPTLTPLESELLDALFEDIRAPLLYDRAVGEDPEATLRDELRIRIEEYGVRIGLDSFYRLFYYLYRRFRGFGPIDAIMNDPHVEDVSCDGYDLPVYVYHDEYQDVETNVRFPEELLDSYVVRLAQQSGRHVSVGKPVLETTLADGSRAELALGDEVTPRGSAFTIRKYSEEPFTPIDLLEYGTYDLDQLVYLWTAIEHNRNLVFAGGTASGKTTSLNAVSMFIPPRSKLITIEDTRELALYHDNWLSSVTRERLDDGSDVSMYDLLRSALRHRPEYILVGEVRGEEAMTLFQAMNTGHTTLSTMHADSVQTVINRLENEPINVPRSMVQSLDVLCVQVLARSNGERVRRADAIAEIEGVDGRTGELDYSTAYEWQPGEDGFREGNRGLLDEIREERGWSGTELLREMRRRRRFLERLHEEGIDDFRQFTAMVNRYYADPDAVMDRIGEREDVDDADGRGDNGLDEEGDAAASAPGIGLD
ncbi:MAG: type II/IV secretion system ATPase subunit [Haloarculaceae archaeon]